MPDKSRKAAHGHAKYHRRKATRQRLADRVASVPQPAQSETTAQATRATASVVQPSEAPHYFVTNELRKIGILGGTLIVILIVVSLILRYAVTIS
jgi:hypothetical protein